MRDTALHCDHLSKRFGNIWAVQALDLTVQAGETLALLGPSGCGKTTTLRLIAGFETADSGRIEIGGKRVADEQTFLPPEQRRVGIVFQDYVLFPHLTVGENVAYGLRKSEGRSARVKEVLQLVGLNGFEERFPHELSGGQQQRVALARALAPKPEILLLDEPFSNLDAGLRIQVRGEVKDILQATGATAIFVTHDQEEALFMGDRVAIFNGGRLEQVGTPEEVFHTPATRFVAEFLGPSWFLPARITAEGLETELGFQPQPVKLSSGTRVNVLVRPDDLTLHPTPDGEARVTRCAFRGMDYLYHVRLPSGDTVQCLGPHTERYAPGTPVRVLVEPNHALIYFVDGVAVNAPRSRPAAANGVSNGAVAGDHRKRER